MEEDIKVEPIELLDLNATAKSGADFRSVEAVGSSILIYDVKQELCDKYDLDVIKAEVHGYGGSENYMEQELHDAVLENHEQDEAEDHMENTKSITDQYENGKRKVSCKNGTSAENNCVCHPIETELGEVVFMDTKDLQVSDCDTADNRMTENLIGGEFDNPFDPTEFQKTDLYTKTAKDYKCHICDYFSTRKFNLEYHIDTVHLKEKKYKCHLCDFAINNKANLSRHINSIHLKVTKLKKFICEICPFSTSHKTCLTRHRKIVHSTLNSENLDVIKHHCSYCDYSSCRKDDFKRHLNKVHLKWKSRQSKTEVNVDENISQSSVCGSSDNSDAEKLLSDTCPEVKCISCDYKTDQEVDLLQHIDSVHSKLKVYKCHLCEYTTKKRYKLKCHNDVVHLKLKNFYCDFCDYSSFHRSHYTRHMESVHSNVKRCKCPFCDYSSSENHTLKKHIQGVHFKVRKYKCNLCDYSANQRRDLERHQNHHGQVKS